MRTVHEPELPKASLTNANPIDPATGQPKKGPKLRLIHGSVKKDMPATLPEKNPANAGLDPSDPRYDPSPPNDNIQYTPAHHPVTGQPGFLISYPPDIQFTPFESEIPADQLMRLLRRQINWAKKQSAMLKTDCDDLEYVRREEWVKKELVFDALMEAEYELSERKGTLAGSEIEEVGRDLRTRDLEWTQTPWWRKKEGTVVTVKEEAATGHAMNEDS